MTVEITKINRLAVDGIPYEPGETITIAPQSKVVFNVRVENKGLLTAMPKKVFVGILREGRWEETYVGDTTWLYPWPYYENHDYAYTVPPDLTPGYYKLGIRTEEMNYYLTVDAYMEEPITPGLGRLEVQSRPTGAMVYINGQLEGSTPVIEDVPSGDYRVRVSMKGYKVKDIIGAYSRIEDEAIVRVYSGQRSIVTFVLEEEVSLWKSAWFWGLMGLGVGAVLAVKKKPEYVRRAKEVVKPYAERAREVVKPYAERVVGVVRR